MKRKGRERERKVKEKEKKGRAQRTSFPSLSVPGGNRFTAVAAHSICDLCDSIYSDSPCFHVPYTIDSDITYSIFLLTQEYLQDQWDDVQPQMQRLSALLLADIHGRL